MLYTFKKFKQNIIFNEKDSLQIKKAMDGSTN